MTDEPDDNIFHNSGNAANTMASELDAMLVKLEAATAALRQWLDTYAAYEPGKTAMPAKPLGKVEDWPSRETVQELLNGHAVMISRMATAYWRLPKDLVRDAEIVKTPWSR